MSRSCVTGCEGWALVGWVALAVAAVTVWILATHGREAEGLRQLIRATARISGTCFLGAFLAAPLCRLRPNPATAWLLRNRRGLGVSVGVSHVMHGLAIVAFVRLTGHETPTGSLVAALLAYLLLAAMVATSFDTTAGWLGRRAWSRLHRTGLYYLWLVFGFTFFGTATAGDAVSAGFALLYGLALPLRWLGLRGRTEAPPAPTQSSRSKP